VARPSGQSFRRNNNNNNNFSCNNNWSNNNRNNGTPTAKAANISARPMAALAEGNEVKLTSSQLRDMNDNLDLSNALTIESVSQNNNVNSNHIDEHVMII